MANTIQLKQNVLIGNFRILHYLYTQSGQTEVMHALCEGEAKTGCMYNFGI